MKRTFTILASMLTLCMALACWPMATAQEEGATGQAGLKKGVAETRAETARTRDQLQATVASLSALSDQREGDLKPTYAAYVAEVEKTHAAAERTMKRVSAMQDASKAYFGTWQQEIGGISNESLRKTAQKRLEVMRKSYDKVVVSLREASTEFKPFLSNLDDIQKMLANDITPAGVKAVHGVVDDADSNVKRVSSAIVEASEELESMETALSSKTE
jgi:hypothetical protein